MWLAGTSPSSTLGLAPRCVSTVPPACSCAHDGSRESFDMQRAFASSSFKPVLRQATHGRYHEVPVHAGVELDVTDSFGGRCDIKIRFQFCVRSPAHDMDPSGAREELPGLKTCCKPVPVP